jgi:hypothetical protein
MSDNPIVCLLGKFEKSTTVRICRKSSVNQDWWSFFDEWGRDHGIGEVQEVFQCDLVIDADVIEA